MKKTFIILAIAILLVAGYFVGSAKFSSNETRVASEYSSGGSSLSGMSAPEPDLAMSTKSGSSDVQSSISNSYIDNGASLTTTEDDVIRTAPECQAVGLCDPMPVGDPKGTKIVKSGTIAVSIKKGSIGEKYDDVVGLIPSGGYIEASNSTPTSSELKLRIPADKLDATLVALRKLGNVKEESIGSTDRTYESIDYDARLKIMRERETVLNELLKKAATASETASIQEQIFALRTDIESLQGLKDVLESQVALSTLTVTLTEKGAKAVTPGKRTMIAQAWETSAGALLTSVGGIMIVLTSLFPFFILGAVLIYVARRLVKRNNETKNASPAQLATE